MYKNISPFRHTIVSPSPHSPTMIEITRYNNDKSTLNALHVALDEPQGDGGGSLEVLLASGCNSILQESRSKTIFFGWLHHLKCS